MSTTIISGALPPLDAKKHEKVLDAPTSKLKSKTNVGKLFYLLAFLIAFLFLVFGVLWFVKKSGDHNTANPLSQKEISKPAYTQKNEALASTSIEDAKKALKEKQREEEQAAADQAAMDAIAAQESHVRNAMPNNQTTSNNQQNATTNEPPKPTPRERKLSGAVLVDYSGNAQPVTQTSATLYNNDTAQNNSATYTSHNDESISARLQPTVLKSSIAGVLPNLNYLLKRGTTIPCALKTGINTTLAGFVMCTTISDVYSANGKTLLIERGASLFGEQQSSLKQGQERVFVLWTRIDNPSGVFANLDSPGTDQMGFNGVPGYVETHFWKRFGGAIMLSMIKDFSQIVVNKQSPGNGTTYNNTSQVPQDMAAEALRNSINIPPTLIVNPATIVHVLVARDISFENVYALAD